MKKLLIIIFILSISIYITSFMQEEKVDIDTQLKQKATPDYINGLITKSLANDDIETAMMYKNLTQFLHIQVEQNLLDKLKEENSTYKQLTRNTKNFFDGFVSGDYDNSSKLIGKVASDFTVVGDARDIYNEGNKLYNNEDYDKTTLGLSAIGIGLTASTFFTFGSTAPAKVGVSLLKVAKTSGNISKKLLKVISSKVNNSVDFGKLKTINFSSLSGVKKSKDIIKSSINIKPIKKILDYIQVISKNTSNLDTIKLLKYADNEKDIATIAKLSKKYKANTLAVFKVLGKGVLKGAKIITKYSIWFIIQIISWVGSVILLLISLIKLKNKGK